MKTYFTDILEKGENGLYLCQMPTGSGKTYSVVEAIKDYVIGHREDNSVNSTKGTQEGGHRDNSPRRKIIYLTTLNKNVIDTELQEAFGDEGLYSKNVLHIRANLDEVIEKLPTMDIPSSFRNEQYFNLKESIGRYCEQEKRKSEGKKVDDVYLDILRKETFEAERAFRGSLGKELNRRFKQDKDDKKGAQLKERKLEAIRYKKEYRWIGELYPAVFTDDHQVLLMSVSKFIMKNSTIVERSYPFLEADFIKDAVIFIDEFDSTKEMILHSLIQSALRLNQEYISLFRLIANGLSYDTMPFQIRRACLKAGRSEHETLVEKAEEIIERHHVDRCFKTDRESVSRRMNFLFKDSAYHTFASDKREYVRTVFDRNENRSVIYIETKEDYDRHINEHDERKSEYEEYLKSGKPSDSPKKDPGELVFMYVMLREIDVFIMRFNAFLSKWAEAYADIINAERHPTQVKMTADNAKSSILHHMSINEDGRVIITGHVPVSRKKKVRKKDILPDISFYHDGFRVLNLVDDDSHNENTDMRIFKLGETPEKILSYLSQNASVIGISATAEVPTVISNYDLDNQKDVLGESFHFTPKWLKEKMAAELEPKWRAYRDGRIKVSASMISTDIPDGSILKRCKEIFTSGRRAQNCASLIRAHLDSAGEAENTYYAARYCAIAESMHWFCESKARSMLSLSMAYPRNSYWKMDKGLLEHLLKECCRDCGLESGAVSLFILHDRYDAAKEELLMRLSAGEKIYVMSSYKTIGAGQNLQYHVDDLNGLIDLYPEGRGNDHRNNEKDFDAMYLGDITNAVVNLNGEKLEKEDLMIKIAQIEELLEHAEISRTDATDLFRKVIDKYTGEGGGENYHDISYETESVNMVSTQMVIQAVGRMCRTHIRSSEIRIFLESRLVKKLSRAEFDRHILSPELSAVRELLHDKDDEPAREAKIILNRAESTSERGNRLLRSILARGWNETEMDLWNNLRDTTLKYPTACAALREKNELIRKLYITSGNRQNQYLYLQTGDYSRVLIDFDMNRTRLERKKKSELEGDGYIMTMSEAKSRLDAVLRYPNMREFFEQSGYACSFEENDYMMSPVIFNNIYKGALGEAAGRFIVENELGIKLKPITDPKIFEFFDYVIAPDVYVDFKNWKFTYQVRRADIYKEIEEKLHEIGGKRAYVINLLSDGDVSPVSTVGGHIIEITRLIDTNGNIDINALKMLAGEGL